MDPMQRTDEHPHGRHCKHCYVYEGSFCSCGGDYEGPDAGPRLDLPPRPFSLSAGRPSLPASRRTAPKESHMEIVSMRYDGTIVVELTTPWGDFAHGGNGDGR